MANTFTFNAANVVVGDSETVGYAFSTSTTGSKRMSVHRETGTAVVDIDGNVSAHGLRLVHVNHNGVLVSGPDAGSLAVMPDTNVGDASFFTAGVLDPARVMGDYQFGNVTLPTAPLYAATFTGNANASSVTSGTLDANRLSGSYAFQNARIDNVVAHTVRGNIDSAQITSGTVDSARLTGSYGFGGLTLSGPVTADAVRANVDASFVTQGTIDPSRLSGSYTLENVQLESLSTAVLDPNVAPNKAIESSGPSVQASSVTDMEIAAIRGVTSRIQDQLANIENGLVVGNTINNLDATQFTLGTLQPDRLQGTYSWTTQTLSGDVVVPSVSANLDASRLDRGTVHQDRLGAPSYAHVSNLSTTGNTTAATVSANLNASQLADGSLHPARLAGGYDFESLDVSTANAVWISGNLDSSRIVMGTIPQARIDLDPVSSTVTSALGADVQLGTPASRWAETVAIGMTANVLDVATEIRKGQARMQMDLETTASNIVAASSNVTVGTSTTPWSSLSASTMITTDFVVGGDITNVAGESLSFDLTKVPTDLAPKSASSLALGSSERPFGTLDANSMTTMTLSTQDITTDLRPSTAYGLGTPVDAWNTVVAANVTGAISGNLVGDIWGEVDLIGDVIDVLGGVNAPNESRSVRFAADESVGIGYVAPSGIRIETTGSSPVVVASGSVEATANLVSTMGSLGSTEAWRDVYASAVRGPLGSLDQMAAPAAAAGTVSAANVVVAGHVSATDVLGNMDASSLTGTLADGLFGSSYVITTSSVIHSLTATGSLTSGNIVPSVSGSYDLGSPALRFRDVYVSPSSMVLGSASVSETGGNVVISSNVIVTDGISGDGLGVNLHISNVVITDSEWTVVDDTAVSLDGGYCVVTGTGFAPGSLAIVGGTHATSTRFVSSSELRVSVPPKPSGTYDLTIVRQESKYATLPSAITYSQNVTWTTSSVLGNVYAGDPFSMVLQATSDSAVTYSNVSPLPPDTSLDPINGTLSGNISALTSTLYSFDVAATDAELQDATRTFLLHLLVLLINGTQYTDASWTPLTQTALDANSGSVYFTVDGAGMNEVTGVLVDGTPATSFVAASDSLLRVTAPQKPRGVYDVTVQNTGQSKVIQNGVFYSDVPTWTTDANLGTVDEGVPFDISLQASSDSAVLYSNVTSLPVSTTLNGTTGNLQGNIVIGIASEGLYSFDILATDEENQVASRTFILQCIRQILFLFTTATFGTGGLAAGTTSGPTLAEALTTLAGPEVATWKSAYFSVSGGIQTWTVPFTGTYTIQCTGAKGGDSSWTGFGNRSGGLGARMQGDFALTRGSYINILVGQAGDKYYYPDSWYHGGGGGGTFVWNQSDDTLLIAAGGGGGAGTLGYPTDYGYGNGVNASTGTSGTACRSNEQSGGSNGNGGNSNGNGGDAYSSEAGGGAGWLTNGGGVPGGIRPLEGGQGGVNKAGFGGGGGVIGIFGGGGGGGYSGGGASSNSTSRSGGGGGGSYNSGTNQTNTAGVGAGSGSVVITFISF